jgi:sugar O-acyltransferase (sialic acid O-acetyltransferase NeuD family)
MSTTKDKMVKLAGIGIGGSSKVIWDILEQYRDQYQVVGWFDDDETRIGTKHLDVEVLDTIDNVDLYRDSFDEVFLCIGATRDTKNRNAIFNNIKSKNIPTHTVISKAAVISPKAKIGEGCIILDRVVVNSGVTLEDNVFLNTGCIVEHDCTIKSSSFISPGAVLCGNVLVEANVFVGANSVIIGNRFIGSSSVIGAGSVVISNVDSHSLIVGNPGKNINK